MFPLIIFYCESHITTVHPLYAIHCKERTNLCSVHLVNTGAYDRFPIMTDDPHLFCMYIDRSDGRVVFVWDSSS